MFTLTLTLLFLLALGLLVWNRSRWALAAVGAALILLEVAGTGLIATPMLNALQRPYPRVLAPRWGKRNAVVLLGAGAIRPGSGPAQAPLFGHGRILEAIRLYRACRAEGKACTLLISGGDPGRFGRSEAAIYGQEALALGVASADLVLEERSLNTFKNAEYSCPLLTAGGFDQVYLVTSGIHMTRSLRYFEHFGQHCQPAAADHLAVIGSALPSSYNLTLTDLALHERLGVLRYRLYQALGWNPKTRAAGAA